MTKSPLVSIIVVNWNGKSVLVECLKTLQKLNYPNWELILVDNGSSDGSETIVKNYKLKAKRIHIIKNKENKGFAEANNQGFVSSKGEYILLLNNDTEVTPGFLTPMIKKMELNQSIGVMQPKIYLTDNPGHLDNCGSFLNTIGFTEHWGYGSKDSKEFDREREIFSAKGACLLTRRSVIDKTGLFDAEFHSYFEESDFCWRVWLAGWKVVYYPKEHIYHKVGFTSKKMSQVDINYYALKNRISSFYKNLGILNLARVLLVHLIFVLGLGFYYLVKLQFAKSGMVFGAILWNITNIGANTKKRITTQKLRTKTDKEIFSVIMHKTDFSHMFSHFKKVEANFK